MIHARRARGALAALRESDPAISALALWCIHRDGDGPTLTRGDTILYGPDFAALDRPRQVGLAAHHILHVALRHAGRKEAMRARLGPGFDPDLYTLAADAIVNEALVLGGHALPRPFVTLTGVLQKAGLGTLSPQAALAEWDADRLALALHKAGRDAAKAAREHGEEKGFHPDLEGDTASQSAEEGDRAAADWRGHIARALEAGRAAGTGIGAHAATFADFAPPRVPWETRLRGLLARALLHAPAPSYRRPAGRWAAMEAEARRRQKPIPAFQPGRVHASARPRIVVCLDTSSSIDDLTLGMFGAEIAAIAARTGAETHVIAFDDAVHHESRLPPGDRDALARLSLRRGGGTAFDPALERAAALGPSAVVCLTDLEGPVGPAPTRAPVFWAVPEGNVAKPPFGTLIPIPR